MQLGGSMTAAKKTKPVIARDWWQKSAPADQQASRLVNLVEKGRVTKSDDLPEFLTPTDVAKHLKCHPKTASEHMRNGVIRSVKHGGRRVTTTEWLADYMRKVLKGHG